MTYATFKGPEPFRLETVQRGGAIPEGNGICMTLTVPIEGHEGLKTVSMQMGLKVAQSLGFALTRSALQVEAQDFGADAYIYEAVAIEPNVSDDVATLSVETVSQGRVELWMRRSVFVGLIGRMQSALDQDNGPSPDQSGA
jgi:hypothetical protein